MSVGECVTLCTVHASSLGMLSQKKNPGQFPLFILPSHDMDIMERCIRTSDTSKTGSESKLQSQSKSLREPERTREPVRARGSK